MIRPLVSVVVPVYNGEDYLAFALQSVLEQDYRPFEIIVVDDGSLDNTAEIVRSYDGVRYIYQPNQGPAAARNAGVAAAQGEFIAFLDADDVWAPNKLSVQMDHLVKHLEVGYVVAKAKNFLESGTNLPAWLPEELFMKEASFLPSTLVVRKPVFYTVGEFDRHYTIGEDTDWFARSIDANVRYFVVPETLSYRRIHDSNLSSQTQLNRNTLISVTRRAIGHRRRQEAGNG